MTKFIEVPKFSRTVLLLAAAVIGSFLLAACGGGGGGGGGGAAATPVTVAVSPKTATVITGLSLQLAAKVTGTTATTVAWSVNGVAGGNAAVGTIDAAGLYTAPAVKPAAPSTVTVTATLVADATKKDSAVLTIADLVGGYAGSFIATGAMKDARSNHSATLLTTGNVLVAGGIGAAGTPIATSEIYRPTFGTFTSVGAMTTSRAYHAATTMQDGRVLITGGVDAGNNVLAQAEIYDPAAGTFTVTGSMATARAYHTATLLADGKILVAGGSESADLAAGVPLADIELFDPATGTFTTPAGLALAGARYYHTATRLKDGNRVLLAGGVGSGGAKLASAEIYDLTTGAITAAAPMLTGRWLHNAVLLNNGNVLITGGSSGTIAGGLPSATYLAATEVYDPVADTFTATVGQLIDTRAFFTTTLLADQTLLSTGGFGLLSTAPAPFIGSTLATAELFAADISGAAYTGPLPQQRANQTATLLPASGKVLIVGGNGYSGGSFSVLNSALLYQ